MLQPSMHPLIKDYEAAQDSVGQWFASLGLVRGERRAAAIRAAPAKMQTSPKRRYHAKTKQWRAQQALRLKTKAAALKAEKAGLEQRDASVSRREKKAETVLAVAEGVASGAFIADASGDAPTLIAVPNEAKLAAPKPTLDELRQRSPSGFARAAGVLGRAWSCLFGEVCEMVKKEAAGMMPEAVKLWGITVPVSSSGRRKWPAALRAKAVQKILAVAGIPETAEEIGACKSLVALWVKKADTSMKSPAFVEVVAPAAQRLAEAVIGEVASNDRSKRKLPKGCDAAWWFGGFQGFLLTPSLLQSPSAPGAGPGYLRLCSSFSCMIGVGEKRTTRLSPAVNSACCCWSASGFNPVFRASGRS